MPLDLYNIKRTLFSLEHACNAVWLSVLPQEHHTHLMQSLLVLLACMTVYSQSPTVPRLTNGVQSWRTQGAFQISSRYPRRPDHPLCRLSNVWIRRYTRYFVLLIVFPSSGSILEVGEVIGRNFEEVLPQKIWSFTWFD